MTVPAFTVVIPARLASTRLPDKPLADIGGRPMIVRVAERAHASSARRTVVATDAPAVAQACAAHGIEAVLTRADHPSGTDRLSEVAAQLGLADDAIVVNVQGDEPLIEPSLIDEVALHLAHHADCAIATAAHPLQDIAEVFNPNVVKVVCDAAGRALYFSRAPIPWARDAWSGVPAVPAALAQVPLPGMPVLRHIGLYAYRAGFCAASRRWRRRRWSRPRRWSNCAPCGMASALRCCRPAPRRPPASTPRPTWNGCAHCGRSRWPRKGPDKTTRAGVCPLRFILLQPEPGADFGPILRRLMA